MDNSLARKAIQEFDAANGGRENSVVDGNWIIFANGASRENAMMCALIDPPSDPRQLAHRVLRYRQVVLDNAARDFEDRKAALREQAAHAMKYAGASAPPPPPSEEALDELRRLQLKVQKARRAYNAARVDQTPKKTPAELAAIEARRTQGERARTIIDEIKI